MAYRAACGEAALYRAGTLRSLAREIRTIRGLVHFGGPFMLVTLSRFAYQENEMLIVKKKSVFLCLAARLIARSKDKVKHDILTVESMKTTPQKRNGVTPSHSVGQIIQLCYFLNFIECFNNNLRFCLMGKASVFV